MNCVKVREVLSAYHDGELPEREARRVARHLLTCARCRERLSALARIDQAGAIPDPGQAYWDRLADSVMKKVGGEPAPQRSGVKERSVPRTRRFPRWGLAAAAALVLAVAGGMHLKNSLSPDIAREVLPEQAFTGSSRSEENAARQDAVAPSPEEPPKTMPAAPPPDTPKLPETGKDEMEPAPTPVPTPVKETKTTPPASPGRKRIAPPPGASPAPASPSFRKTAVAAAGGIAADSRAESSLSPPPSPASPSPPARDKGNLSPAVTATEVAPAVPPPAPSPARADFAAPAAPAAPAESRTDEPSITVLYAEALRLSQEGKMSEAIGILETVRRKGGRDPLFPRAMLLLARILDGEGRAREADLVLVDAYALAPGDPDTRQYLELRKNKLGKPAPPTPP